MIKTGPCYRIFLVMLLLVCMAGASMAQQPYYKRYTQTDGFPSTIVYNIVQDKQHFLWFSTENGVCRFDGRNIKHFTPVNSRFDFGVFHLYTDSKNRLWGISIYSAPIYYLNNHFYTLPKAIQPHVHNTRWILEDSKGYIYFFTREGTIVRWLAGNDYTVLNVTTGPLTGGALINDTTLMTSGLSEILRVTNFNLVEILPVKGYTHEPTRFYKFKENLVIGYATDGLYQYTPGGYKMIYRHTDAFSSISYAMHVDNDSTIWLATRNGVHIYHYRNNNLHFVSNLFPGNSILAIHKDHNGNYWIAAANEAIYFINATPNKYYRQENRKLNVNQVCFIGNTAHIFTSMGNHFALQQDSLAYKGNTIANTPTLTYLKATNISDSCILISFRGGNAALFENEKLQMQQAGPFLSFNNYYYRNDGKTFSVAAYNNRLKVYEVQGHNTRQILNVNTNLTFDLAKMFCFDHSNRCWSSSGDTLICVEPVSEAQAIVHKYPTGGIFISDIRCDSDNNIWIATKGGGVYGIKDNHTILNYSTSRGMVSNFCSSLYIDSDNNVWVCTQNGLNKICKDKNGNHIIKAFTKDNLLPLAVVNCVYKKGNTVYAGTTDGLFTFEDTDTATNALPVYCYITSISVDGKNMQLKNNYTLKYGKSINIGFSTIDFNQSAAPVFYYTLEGSEKHWNTTTTGQIQYGQLKPGDYTFRVYSGKYPTHTVSLSIHVLPPFWLRWWFLCGAALFLILLSFAASYIVVRIKHRKAELARKMLENDLRSLRAQINPHFIFNALNSIQDFVLDQQPRIANHYLTSFARLMRMIIDNSKKEWISLASEIYFLKLYLELEKLRMGDDLVFSIITDAGIDAELLHIPPMLIQPLVENSIKHGLAGKPGAKHIEIHFSLQQRLVYCRIKDNGMGREHAATVAAKNMPRQSTGIENIRERLQLLYTKQNLKNEPVIITDMYNGTMPAGTLVELYIPYFIDN